MFQHDIATSAFEICNYFLLVWDVYCDLTPSPASPHTFCNTLVMRNARLELAISPKQHGSFPCKRSKKGFQGDVKPEHFTSFWLRGELFHEGNNLAPGAQLCAPHISSPPWWIGCTKRPFVTPLKELLLSETMLCCESLLRINTCAFSFFPVTAYLTLFLLNNDSELCLSM